MGAKLSTADIQSDEAALKGRLEAWFSLMKEKRLEDVVNLYTTDCVILPPKQPIHKGHEDGRRVFRQFIEAGVTCLHTGYVTLDIHGNIAITVSTYSIQDGEEKEIETGSVLNTWKKLDDGLWYMFRGTWGPSS
ncbi:unnamed protein product [Owenia fusiformis]|uniref:SnoaL-like domain-containing protein n=1 Tax=Owenia fusiformis TaxID=6347 RepID=A0A8S4PVA1_OWEFU|nr:unnamed protein product [Owenia fusiformis]